MNISLQSSKSNDWNSNNSAGHLTVPLKSLTMGKEMAIDVPATDVRGLNWMGIASENTAGGAQGPQWIITFPSGSRTF